MAPRRGKTIRKVREPEPPARPNRGAGQNERPQRGQSRGGTYRSAQEPLGVGRTFVAEVERRNTPNWQYPYILSRPIAPGAARSISPATRYEGGPNASTKQVPIGAPRYFVDDEFRPATRPADEIIDMQRRLAVAGFLTEDVDLGVWDENTISAYKKLLEYANTVGMDADAALYHYARSSAGRAAIGGGGGEDGGGGGGGGRGGRGGGFVFDPETGEFVPAVDTFIPPPLELRTTNKDDLRRVFRSAVTGLLGQGWSQAEINELVDAYNWNEIRLQKQEYDQRVEVERADFMGERTTGGETILQQEPPTPEAFIEEEARRRDPMGFKATQIAEDYAPAFFQAIRGLGF